MITINLSLAHVAAGDVRRSAKTICPTLRTMSSEKISNVRRNSCH